MTKLSRKYTDPVDMGLYVNDFWSALTLMESKEDIRRLVKDLFTHTEYKMLAKRLQISRMLLDGYSYDTIEKKLHVTPVTISRASNILAEKGDGLRKAHEMLTLLERKNLAKQREKTKNLENHFRQKTKMRTVGGTLIKVGLRALNKKVRRVLKTKSAEQIFNI